MILLQRESRSLPALNKAPEPGYRFGGFFVFATRSWRQQIPLGALPGLDRLLPSCPVYQPHRAGSLHWDLLCRVRKGLVAVRRTRGSDSVSAGRRCRRGCCPPARAGTVLFVVAERPAPGRAPRLVRPTALRPPTSPTPATSSPAAPTPPGIADRLRRVSAGADGVNRNVLAPGEPLWNWHVSGLRRLRRLRDRTASTAIPRSLVEATCPAGSQNTKPRGPKVGAHRLLELHGRRRDRWTGHSPLPAVLGLPTGPLAGQCALCLLRKIVGSAALVCAARLRRKCRGSWLSELECPYPAIPQPVLPRPACRPAASAGVSASAVRWPIFRPGRARPSRRGGASRREWPAPRPSWARRLPRGRPAGSPSPRGAAVAWSPAAGRTRRATAARTGWSRRRRSSNGRSCAAAAPAR